MWNWPNHPKFVTDVLKMIYDAHQLDPAQPCDIVVQLPDCPVPCFVDVMGWKNATMNKQSQCLFRQIIIIFLWCK